PPARLVALAPVAHLVAGFGLFELDDFGAHVAEKLSAEGASDQLSHLDYPDAVERSFIFRHCVPFGARTGFEAPAAMASTLLAKVYLECYVIFNMQFESMNGKARTWRKIERWKWSRSARATGCRMNRPSWQPATRRPSFAARSTMARAASR